MKTPTILGVTIFTTMFFLIVPLTFAQAPAIEWEKSLGGSGPELGGALQKTNDGGYVTVGMSWSTDGDVTGNHGGYDYWVVKLTNLGQIEWEKSLGGSYEDDGGCIQQTFDGGYIVSGSSASNDGNVTEHYGNCVTPNYWIVKLTPMGDIQWEKSIGMNNAREANAVVQTRDSGYVVAGDSWLIKLTSVGEIEWQKPLEARPNSLAKTIDGGYILAGNSNASDSNVPGNHGGADYWIAKLSNLGEVQWQKSLGGSGDDYAGTIIQTSDSGYIVNGQSNSNDGNVTGNHGADNYWVVKLTSIGDIQWEKSLGGSSGDFGTCVTQTRDGGFIVCGMCTSSDGDVTNRRGGYGNYWIVKLSNLGEIRWQKCYGGSGSDQAGSILQTDDNGYIVAGSSKSTDGDVTGNHSGSYDYWIVKLGPEGAPSNVNQTPVARMILVLNYPDPITSSTRISIPGASNPKVSIVDLMGREIAKLQPDASNQFVWSPDASIPSGTYFILARTSMQSTMKPVVFER